MATPHTEASLYAPLPSNWGYHFSDATECIAYDFFRHPDNGEVEMKERRLDEASLPDYLAESESPFVAASPRKSIYGLKLLVAKARFLPTGAAMICVDTKSFGLIKQHFDLHDLFIDLMLSRGTQALVYSSPCRSDASPDPILYFKSRFFHDFQLSLKYDPTTNITSGFLVTLESSVTSDNLESLMAPLNTQLKICRHPMLLPISITELHINGCWRNLQLLYFELDRIQNMTGQNPYGIDHNILTARDLLTLEFPEYTSSLNYFSESCSGNIFILKGLSGSLTVLESWGRAISVSHLNGGVEDSILDAQSMMLEKLDYLRSTIGTLLLQGERIEKRIDTYRQLIYQLMAQKDSKTNIELAQSSAAIAKAAKEDSAVMRQIALETKRDSSAMKTIAMLTMVFLPGTSIAAIFAMPVIKWDRWDSGITGFSLYWVVTLPLTLLVFMVWGAAVVLPWRSWLAKRGRSRREKENDEELGELDESGRAVAA